MLNQRLYTSNDEGVFESPLGGFDSSDFDRWETVGDYLEEIFVHNYPQSKIVEEQTGRNITYRLYLQVNFNLTRLKTEQKGLMEISPQKL